MRKMNGVLYIDEGKQLYVTQPLGRTDWIVLNANSALMYGPDNFANCISFVENHSNDR